LCYSSVGGWETKTGHNAPLYKNDAETATDVSPSFIRSRYNCHASIQSYIAAGIPRSKLIMGLGLYGRGWQGNFIFLVLGRLNLVLFLHIGVTSTAQNGFSQAASSQLPMGTWENGIYDYDHLKKSFLPTYTRYWDDASKVPFLFNPSTGIWISYDDLQSIALKNEYIKQEKLGGAMFWELSSDRNAELVGATYTALNNGQTISFVTNPSTSPTSSAAPTNAPSSTASASTTQAPGGNVSAWAANRMYSVGDRVLFEGKTYQCLQPHTSLPGWTPVAVPALWKLI
jgi:chitinase